MSSKDARGRDPHALAVEPTIAVMKNDRIIEAGPAEQVIERQC